jgi:hypothetical protein
MLSWDQLVGPGNRSCNSETYQRGSTLTGFAFSSPLIVVFYHWGGWKSGGTLGWSESERNVGEGGQSEGEGGLVEEAAKSW